MDDKHITSPHSNFERSLHKHVWKMKPCNMARLAYVWQMEKSDLKHARIKLNTSCVKNDQGPTGTGENNNGTSNFVRMKASVPLAGQALTCAPQYSLTCAPFYYKFLLARLFLRIREASARLFFRNQKPPQFTLTCAPKCFSRGWNYANLRTYEVSAWSTLGLAKSTCA